MSVPRSASDAAEASGGLRIVLVDNDPAVLDLLELDIGLEGHTVLASLGDAQSAIDACKQLEPDVLVVDLRLGPGPDGLDVAKAVARPDLRIVLHTNYINTEVIRRARAAGVTVVEKGSLSALRKAIVATD
jgi:DNA-binding NarL/FixJ family response regulator